MDDNGYMRQHKNQGTRPLARLKLIAAGAVLILVGTVRLLNGVQVVRHWTGQPMFSVGLVAAGGLCILLAFIPTSWIEKAVGTPHDRLKRFR